ncbi:MAG: hypothetical protein IJH11_00370 [Lachnospiraceae bacterium]|nr:hypothetical protein [Lachnospiraceae bacterium]
MRDIEKDNPTIRPEEGDGRDVGNSQDLITEDVVRGMFGESGDSVKRRQKRQKRRRTMPDGEIRDPFENMDQKLEEEKRRREKGIDVPDFVLEGQKKPAEKKRKKSLRERMVKGRKKTAAGKSRNKSRAAEEVRHDAATETDDMIIDDLKEKVKNDDGRMSTSGFIIAMAVLFVGMLAIVLVTFTISRMARAVTGGADSSAYESAVDIASEPAEEPESE